MDQNNNYTRRQVVTGLENPLNKYPQPPFQPQSQSWPALASGMIPKPDHGEECANKSSDDEFCEVTG